MFLLKQCIADEGEIFHGGVDRRPHHISPSLVRLVISAGQSPKLTSE